jgi:hypothetical protein
LVFNRQFATACDAFFRPVFGIPSYYGYYRVLAVAVGLFLLIVLVIDMLGS